MKPAYPIAVLLAAAPLPAHALALHVAVLADPHDGDAGRAAARAVELRLSSSGSYDPIPAERLVERYGGDPGALFRACGDDEACWREAGLAMRVEALILVERLDKDVGVRTLVVSGDEPFRRDLGPAGPDQGPPGELIDQMFFSPGELHVSVTPAPERAWLRIDGTYDLPLVAGRADVAAIAPGKHTVEITGLDTPFFSPIVITPGQSVAIDFDAANVRPPRPRWQRWTTAVGVFMVVAAVGLGLAAEDDPPLVRIP